MNTKEVIELSKLFMLQGMTTDEAIKIATEIVQEQEQIQYRI